MKKFVVTWTIEVEALTPRRAAEESRTTMWTSGPLAFSQQVTVTGKDDNHVTQINLAEKP